MEVCSLKFVKFVGCVVCSVCVCVWITHTSTERALKDILKDILLVCVSA